MNHKTARGCITGIIASTVFWIIFFTDYHAGDERIQYDIGYISCRVGAPNIYEPRKAQ